MVSCVILVVETSRKVRFFNSEKFIEGDMEVRERRREDRVDEEGEEEREEIKASVIP